MKKKNDSIFNSLCFFNSVKPGSLYSSYLFFLIISLFFSLLSNSIIAQKDKKVTDKTDEMDALLNEATENEIDYTTSTFKAGRIINGRSVENIAKKHLAFEISHRFNQLNQGLYDIFGLDQASIRFGLDYGISNRIQIGIGRSTYEKTYDGYAKFKILRQSKGAKVMPITLSSNLGMYVNTLKPEDTNRENLFSSRLSYAAQIMIARKFNEFFSLQITPTLIHRNLVKRNIDPNDVFAIGFGGRFKVSKRVSINGEYYQILTSQTAKDYFNSLSIGVDIETGGHIFQLHLTNSRATVEKSFIAETYGDIKKGGIYFGFNIVRIFSFEGKRRANEKND